MRLAKRDDWQTIPMPDERRSVAIDRTYRIDEFTRMVAGRVPEVMEHKWSCSTKSLGSTSIEVGPGRVST